MRSIALAIADTKECEAALNAAFKLGRSQGADIVGYHVMPSKEMTLQLNRGELWSGSAMAFPIWTGGDEAIKKAEIKAQSLFERVASMHNYPLSDKHGNPEKPHAIYKVREGAPEKIFTSVGPLHDLIVVSRPSKRGGVTAYAIMVSALLDASTPVLLLPQEKVKVSGERVIIAWNGGQAESVLIHQTLSLLQLASKVTLVTVGKQTGKGPSANDMTKYLSSHGIKASTLTVKGNNAGKTIDEVVQNEKAGLLFCGAYSRGRMREIILGGVTEYLINRSNIPVIMLHV